MFSLDGKFISTVSLPQQLFSPTPYPYDICFDGDLLYVINQIGSTHKSNIYSIDQFYKTKLHSKTKKFKLCFPRRLLITDDYIFITNFKYIKQFNKEGDLMKIIKSKERLCDCTGLAIFNEKLIVSYDIMTK